MDILFLLLIVTFLAFPLGQLTRIELQNGMAFTLFDISLMLFAVCFVLFRILRKKIVVIPHLSGAICFFWLVGFLSLVLNSFRFQVNEFGIAAAYGVRWLFFSFVYFYIAQLEKKEKEKVKKMMLFSAVVTLFIGFLQFWLYPDLRNMSYAGWDEHYLRLFGSFLDPNFTGSFFVLFVLFLLYLYQSFDKKMIFKKISLLLLIGLSFLAVFLTYSRSALVMLVVSICVFLFQIQRKKLAITLIIGIVLLGVLLSSTRSEGTNLFRSTSTFARVSAAREALTLILESPLYGIGFNGFRFVTTPEFPTLQKPDHGASGTDNSFFFILATTGIVGFTVFVYFLQRYYSFPENRGLLTVLRRASIIGIVVNSLFINSLFYPAILFWLWCIAGLSENT